MSTADNPPYTIEELITALTRIADARGWGLQSLTNIREIEAPSGQREISLLAGNEVDIEELENEAVAARDSIRQLEDELGDMESERDALRRRVDQLTGEVFTLKEGIRDMNA